MPRKSKYMPRGAYIGRCCKCEHYKSEYEIQPTAYDLLLCSKCFTEVTKNALRDHEIGLLIEDLAGISKRLRILLS